MTTTLISYIQQRLLKFRSRINFNVTVIILLFCNSNEAQQQFGISLDRANLSILNPAAVDFDFLLSSFKYKLSSTYRGSWTALEGSPSTAVVRAESMIPRDNVSVLMGAQIFSDKIGRFHSNSFSLKYAAIFSDDIDKKGLSVGLSAQLNQYRIDVNNITPENYNKLIGQVGNTSFIRPGVGIGAFYYQELGRRSNDYIYSGLSVPLLFSLNRKSDSSVFKNTIHLFYNAGFIKDLADDYSYIEISAFSKYEATGGLFVSDIRARYNHKNQFNVLVGLNTEKFLLFGFGFRSFLGEYNDNMLFDLNYVGSFNVGGDLFRYFGVLHEINFAVSFGG